MSEPVGRTEQVVRGLRGQNEPAVFEGQKGFWVQGDAVFIRVATPEEAIQRYRDRLGRGTIMISHNHFCGSIQEAKSRVGKQTQAA